MKYYAVKCPNCGGELQVSEDTDSATCIYCQSNFALPPRLPNNAEGRNVRNFLELADDAGKFGNFQEAYEHYTQALQLDTGNARAWIGRGYAAGMLSTVADPRLDETVSCFRKALSLVNDNATRTTVADYTYTVAARLHNLIYEYFQREVTTPESWSKYINIAPTIITALFESIADLKTVHTPPSPHDNTIPPAITCPSCGRKYAYAPELEEQWVTCPDCNGKFYFSSGKSPAREQPGPDAEKTAQDAAVKCAELIVDIAARIVIGYNRYLPEIKSVITRQADGKLIQQMKDHIKNAGDVIRTVKPDYIDPTPKKEFCFEAVVLGCGAILSLIVFISIALLILGFFFSCAMHLHGK
ncbi:MAG: hypothetical protein PHQ27_10020 [Victivallales bacterium]|nr:hypothetical protein [Victivallales bacterium]